MKYKRSPSIVTRHIAGEHLLVPVSGDVADLRQLFSLNETGQVIWNTLADSVSEDQIVAALTNEFKVDEPSAKKDVQDLLAQLLERKLIKRNP